MNIRKHWKRIVLSCAAAFWAGCSDDSTSATQVPNGNNDPNGEESNNKSSDSSSDSPIVLYGVPTYSMSSSEVAGSCSSEVTSSESAPSSSFEEIVSSSSNGKGGIKDTNLITATAGVEVGDKFIAEGDTCEVVSTYDNWFGGATGYGEGLSKGAKEISKKIDEMTKAPALKSDQINCLENVKTMLDNGFAIYGPMPENYPKEVKCSDGIVIETEHYKARLEEYNQHEEDGYNETIKRGNEMIDDCIK